MKNVSKSLNASIIISAFVVGKNIGEVNVIVIVRSIENALSV